MTSREEIERLLNMTGRTLEGLPKHYHSDDVHKRIKELTGVWGLWTGMQELGAHILHQSDVIELLVAALRDALDKPMQKPLTLEELKKAKVVWIEYSEEDKPEPALVENIGDKNAYFTVRKGIYAHAFLDQFGSMWRCWASRPTDEEREAAAWES